MKRRTFYILSLSCLFGKLNTHIIIVFVLLLTIKVEAKISFVIYVVFTLFLCLLLFMVLYGRPYIFFASLFFCMLFLLLHSPSSFYSFFLLRSPICWYRNDGSTEEKKLTNSKWGKKSKLGTAPKKQHKICSCEPMQPMNLYCGQSIST